MSDKDQLKARLAELLAKDGRTKEEGAEINQINQELAAIKAANRNGVPAAAPPAPQDLIDLLTIATPPTPEQIVEFGFTDDDEEGDISERF